MIDYEKWRIAHALSKEISNKNSRATTLNQIAEDRERVSFRLEGCEPIIANNIDEMIIKLQELTEKKSLKLVDMDALITHFHRQIDENREVHKSLEEIRKRLDVLEGKMNDFTKDELENILCSLDGDESVVSVGDELLSKIKMMIDNYCEHKNIDCLEDINKLSHSAKPQRTGNAVYDGIADLIEKNIMHKFEVKNHEMNLMLIQKFIDNQPDFDSKVYRLSDGFD